MELTRVSLKLSLDSCSSFSGNTWHRGFGIKTVLQLCHQLWTRLAMTGTSLRVIVSTVMQGTNQFDGNYFVINKFITISWTKDIMRKNRVHSSLSIDTTTALHTRSILTARHTANSLLVLTAFAMCLSINAVLCNKNRLICTGRVKNQRPCQVHR